MSIHDSALANAELATAIEGVICNICARAPTYAADLVQQAGKLPGSSQMHHIAKQPFLALQRHALQVLLAGRVTVLSVGMTQPVQGLACLFVNMEDRA